MDWKLQLLEGLVILLASGYLGYVLGLKAKRPILVIDFIKTDDKETYVQVNNIGESPARDVRIGNVDLRFKLKPKDLFYEQLNGSKIIFKFDKIPYIESHKPREIKAVALIDGKEESESARHLYGYYLKDFKFLSVTYIDNLGINCRCKLEI